MYLPDVFYGHEFAFLLCKRHGFYQGSGLIVITVFEKDGPQLAAGRAMRIAGCFQFGPVFGLEFCDFRELFLVEGQLAGQPAGIVQAVKRNTSCWTSIPAGYFKCDQSYNTDH